MSNPIDTWYCDECGTLNMDWFDECPNCGQGIRLGGRYGGGGGGSWHNTSRPEVGPSQTTTQIPTLTELLPSSHVYERQSPHQEQSAPDSVQDLSGIRWEREGKVEKLHQEMPALLMAVHPAHMGAQFDASANAYPGALDLSGDSPESPTQSPLAERENIELQYPRPTQGNWVRIREMDPNRSDIEHAVSQEILQSPSETKELEKMRKELEEAKARILQLELDIYQADTQKSREAVDEDVEVAVPDGEDAIRRVSLSQALESSMVHPAPVSHERLDDRDSYPNWKEVRAEDEDDRQSIQSAGSSTTLISTLSGLTVVELESATIELQSIFQDDANLSRLYRCAIKDVSIGPERLQRNVYRLLRNFARDLRREAKSELEKMASNFVTMKARYVAHCIVEEYNDGLGGQSPHQKQKGQEDEELDGLDELAPVDEDYFEDLPTLKAFLVDSAAFQTFHEELTKFVLPKELRPSAVQSATEAAAIDAPSTNRWHFLSLIGLTLRSVLVASELLEPPLPPDMVRLRWQCGCGDLLFGDVREYRHGGINRLVKRMQRSGAGKITAMPYNPGSPSQRYTFEPMRRIRLIVRKATNACSRVLGLRDTSLQAGSLNSEARTAATYISIPPLRVLHLLACMHKTQRRKYLVQDRVETIANDRELFCFIQKQLNQLHNLFWTFLCMRTVKGIHFTKFRLRMGDSVEIRPHNACCRPDVCDCIPKAGNAEYVCTPAGPLDAWPPVMPQEMMHWLEHPHLIDERERSVLNQLPKRMCGQLQATGDGPAEGWGLYYEEGLNVFLIINLVVGTSILASLLFGVLWSILQSDIQGAWGVSSWIVTTSALAVALLVARAKNE